MNFMFYSLNFDCAICALQNSLPMPSFAENEFWLFQLCWLDLGTAFANFVSLNRKGHTYGFDDGSLCRFYARCTNRVDEEFIIQSQSEEGCVASAEISHQRIRNTTFRRTLCINRTNQIWSIFANINTHFLWKFRIKRKTGSCNLWRFFLRFRKMKYMYCNVFRRYYHNVNRIRATDLNLRSTSKHWSKERM